MPFFALVSRRHLLLSLWVDDVEPRGLRPQVAVGLPCGRDSPFLGPTPHPEFSASGRTTTVDLLRSLVSVVKVLVLRGEHEYAVVYVEVHVGDRKISRFDAFAKHHIVAVAGADKDAAAVFDKELPQLELPQPSVFPGAQLQN